ncbi:hypothetical protein LSCM1_00312 [Leishmania martiniquensis]|uniref:PI3K/PI4K catalytic domain-containing protein n=1 Tax=Leishmania martiniquensis TaxID=1580590 RepID=A0A836GBQ2_9TRYP|nr:hypothetical protein LSCM1_00312 [Leishmania martiniquensis]
MDEVISVISKCVTQLARFVDGPTAHASVQAASTTVDTIGKCITDHAYLFTGQETGIQRVWELVCPTSFSLGDACSPATAPTATLLSLFRRLTGAVTASARAPEADILRHLVKLMCAVVKPPLVRGASVEQLRCLFDATMRLLKMLLILRKHTDVQAECLHLLLALMQPSGLQEAQCAALASGGEAAQVAQVCIDLCEANHSIALRPQSASMQLLGCLCEQPDYARTLSRQLVERILKCFLDVARRLTQRAVVNQTLGEGLLRGLTGFLGSFPLRCAEDAPVLALINNIVLSALMLGEKSTNYAFCLSALFLLRRQASGALAPFTLLCAVEYSAALRTLWMHRNRDVRRESLSAAAAFWSTLSSQFQQHRVSEVAGAGNKCSTDASHMLHRLLESLLQSLDSCADREAAYALEALYHLLPAVAAQHDPLTLQAMSTRLEERVAALLLTTSSVQTEALFHQVPYLLATLGQLLKLLPSVSPRQHAVARELVDWVLLLYPHPKFYNREKTVPSVVVVITALMHHPRTPHHTLPRLLSERTLELVGEAPGAAMMKLAGERISSEERLDRMAALWTRLLTSREVSGTEAEEESKQRLSAAFYRACTGFCERAQLEVVFVESKSRATLEKLLVGGADGMQPRFPTQYSAFLSFVDFFARLSEGLRGSGRVCHPPAGERTLWVEALVRGASAAPHVSGFYTLLHRTVVGWGVCPHLWRPEQPDADAPLAEGTPGVISNGRYKGRLRVLPLLRRFFNTECLRRVCLYSEELLYQCAMCVVIGVALLGREEMGEATASGAGACSDGCLDAYVRAFKVVVTATPTPLHDEGAPNGTKGVGYSFSSSPAVLEGNRQCALRVVEKKMCDSPLWAAAVLSALINASRSAEVEAAVRISVQMLAARHGVTIATELQRHAHKEAFALLCRGERVSNNLRDKTPRWLATLHPITVPLAPADSALHVGYLIPLISRLSLHGKQPAVRIAAAEVLRWCAVWTIAKRAREWDSAVFAPVLALASLAGTSSGYDSGAGGKGGSTVPEQLRVLLMQAARWFGRSAGTPQEAESFVLVLLRGLGERDVAQRQIAMEALFAYALPPVQDLQAPTPHLRAVIRQLVVMECGVSEWSRLGAAHCLHVMMRYLYKIKAPGLVRVVQAAVQGAVGCLRRCTEAPFWGTMEMATCDEVQETLRYMGAYCRNLSKLENEEERAEAGQGAADIVQAASAVLPALAQRHTACAIALLQALPAITQASTGVHPVLSPSQQVIRDQLHRLGPAAARSPECVIGGCAVLVAFLRSGCCTESSDKATVEAAPPGISARAENCSVDPELLSLLTVVLQAIVEEARVATYENRCVPPRLMRSLLELVSAAPEQTHATHFSQLCAPAVIAQAVRAMAAGATAAVEKEAGGDGEDVADVVPLQTGALSSLLPATTRICADLIQFVMRVADQRRHGAKVVEEVLRAIQETGVFSVFTAGSPADQLADALSIDPTAPITGSVALAAVLCQVEVPCSSASETLWVRIADSMKISSKVVVEMLFALLRNAAALNAAGGECVCAALLVLCLSEADPTLLWQHLRDLLASAAVPHNNFGTSSSFFDSLDSDDDDDAVAASGARWGSAPLGRAFGSAITRCWQRASAALPTDRLVSALPSLVAVVAPEGAHRGQDKGVFLPSLVGDWLSELQRRPLASEHDRVLCRVCADMVAAEREALKSAPTEAQDDGCGVCRLTLLLMLVRLIGPAIQTDPTLSNLLRDLVLDVGKPADIYSTLASMDATNRVVWGFHMLSAMMTPRPVRRSLAMFPVDSGTVEASSTFLQEVFSNALPLRWTELKTPLEKRNAAEVVRSGTTLFVAVLPHNVQVLEVIVHLLGKESIPQRDTIAREVHRALQALNICDPALQLDAFSCASRLLRDPRTHPSMCDALAEHVLLPLLHSSSASVRLRLVEKEVRKWVAEASTAPVLGRFSVQTAAFSFLALMHCMCPLTDLRGSINAAFTGRNAHATGEELTLEVLKACQAAWQPLSTNGENSAAETEAGVDDSAHADAPHRYRQAAFWCLLAALSQTRQAEQVFCHHLFQENSVPRWSALCPPKRPGVFVTGSLSTEGEEPTQGSSDVPQAAQMWRDMESNQVPELFAHLIECFPSSSVAQGEPPAWVHDFVALMQRPQLRLPVKEVFYRIVCRHERFFCTFARRIFDGVADSVSAMAPSEPAGKVVWDLLGVLARWRREGGPGVLAVGSAASLHALARYAAFHLAWEHSSAPEEESQVLDLTSRETFAELLKQVRRTQEETPASLSTPPLTAEEVKILLSHPVHNHRATLEVLYVVTDACGCLGCTGDSCEVEEVYRLLGAFLDASASPQLCRIAARLVGLEHRLLSEAATGAPLSAAREVLLNTLWGIACAKLDTYVSGTKLLDVLEAMQAEQSGDLVYQLLSRTDILHRYSTRKDSEKLRILRVLARAGTYVADNYDSIHIRLVGQLQGVRGDLFLCIYRVVSSALPHLRMGSVRHVLRDWCSLDALKAVELAEQARVAFYEMGLAALRRWASLRGDEEKQDGGDNDSAGVEVFLVRCGLCDPSPAVQGMVLEYIDSHSQHAPRTMWGRLTCLFTAKDEPNEDDGRGGGGWVRHVAFLLLSLAKRSHSCANPICAFTEASQLEVTYPTPTVNATNAAEGSGARQQPKNVPLFSQAARHSGHVHTGKADVVCPITAALFRHYAAPALAPAASQLQQKPLSGAGHSRISGTCLTDAARRAAARSRLHMERGDPVQGDAAALVGVTASGHIDGIAQPRFVRSVALPARHSATNAPSMVPLLGGYAAGRFLEARLTLKSLLVPLQVLCLHDDEMAARVLIDLVSNAAAASTTIDESSRVASLESTLAFLLPMKSEATIGQCQHAVYPFKLFVALELLLHVQSACGLSLDSVDCAALVRLASDAQTRGGSALPAPLPIADGTAQVVERLLTLLQPLETQASRGGPFMTFPVPVWHAYHMAQRLRRNDDVALQAALRLFKATRGHSAQLISLQSALHAIEVGGEAYSVRAITKLLEDEEEAAATATRAASPATHESSGALSSFAARAEVLRHYRSCASRQLLRWGDAASALESRATAGACESEEASADSVWLRLRAQLQLICDRAASATTVGASTPLQHRTGFEWGLCLMANGRWLDCQHHVETSVSQLLESAVTAVDSNGRSLIDGYLAANALSQLADAAQVLRVVSTSAAGTARAALETYLDKMPPSVPSDRAHGPLFIDDILLIRKLVIDYHIRPTSGLARRLQLTDDKRRELVARAHELLGAWAVRRCVQLLRLPVKTGAIETIAANAAHSTLSEPTRCALSLLQKRSSFFPCTALPEEGRHASPEEILTALLQRTRRNMQQHAASGLLSPTAAQPWAADAAECEVEMLASVGGILSGSAESKSSAPEREVWVSALEDKLRDAAPSHMALLSALEKLLPLVPRGGGTLGDVSEDAADAAARPPSVTAATRSLWLLYANTFLWCAQAGNDRSIDADSEGHLPVSARVPRLLSLFALPPATQVEAEGRWRSTWEALVLLPAQVWLPWANLLVNMLVQTEHVVLARILLRLCREHGQVLYYPVNCAWGSLVDLRKRRNAGRVIDDGLASELAELQRWYKCHRMALVAEFTAALEELVEPQHRLEMRLSGVELLVKQHEECTRGCGGSTQTKYLTDALQLYERCKDDLMNTARWGRAQLFHRRAAQVLQELDRRKAFSTEVLQSVERFRSAKREALSQVTEALSALSTAESSGVTRSQELAMYSERLPRALGCSATAATTRSQLGCTSDAAEPILQPVQPTHLLHTPQSAGQQCRTLVGVEDRVLVLHSKRLPKRVKIYTCAGACTYMVKGGEGLRRDQRIQEVFTLANMCLLLSPCSRPSALMIRTYAVIPVSPFVGLVGWVPKTAPLQELMKAATPPDARKAVEHFRRAREKQGDILSLYKGAQVSRSPEGEYEGLVLRLRQSALAESLEGIAPDHCSWFGARDAFLDTNAAASMVCFVLGVGNRHPRHSLVDRLNCELVAIDFGLAFGDATRKLPAPELTPFRHTPQLQRVQGVLGDDVTRCRMRRVLHVLRTEQPVVEGMVAALLMADVDAIGDEASCIAAHQLDVVRGKLNLESPAEIILRDVALNAHVTRDKDVWSGVKECLLQRKRDEKEEDCELSETALSTLHLEDVFVQRLLRIASDPRVLGRACAGWQAYL